MEKRQLKSTQRGENRGKNVAWGLKTDIALKG